MIPFPLIWSLYLLRALGAKENSPFLESDLPPAPGCSYSAEPPCHTIACSSESVSWGQVAGVLSSLGLIHPSFRCSLQNQLQGKGGEQAGGRGGDFRKSPSSLALTVCPIMNLQSSTCPPAKELVTVLSPPRHRPLAHFLLFLLPTCTPPASCGSKVKFPISGSRR